MNQRTSLELKIGSLSRRWAQRGLSRLHLRAHGLEPERGALRRTRLRRRVRRRALVSCWLVNYRQRVA